MNTRSIIIFSLLTLFLASFGFVWADEGEDAFPVTIEHKFGSTTIAKEPQRIVSIGFTEQDPLLALGVTPVAAARGCPAGRRHRWSAGTRRRADWRNQWARANDAAALPG